MKMTDICMACADRHQITPEMVASNANITGDLYVAGCLATGEDGLCDECRAQADKAAADAHVEMVMRLTIAIEDSQHLDKIIHVEASSFDIVEAALNVLEDIGEWEYANVDSEFQNAMDIWSIGPEDTPGAWRLFVKIVE
jgi:hypothetical protein